MRWFVGFICYGKDIAGGANGDETKHDAIVEWDGQKVEDLLKICEGIVDSKRETCGLKWLDKLSNKIDKINSHVHVECLTRLD